MYNVFRKRSAGSRKGQVSSVASFTILFGCGHIAEAEVQGNEYEQERKLAYLKICGRCPQCEKKRQELICNDLCQAEIDRNHHKLILL
jgi:hypothetical protein